MFNIIHWLNAHPEVWPVFIFFARIADVSIGTLRTICVIRGMRILAPVLGFFEVAIWITAVSGVLTHLDHWYNVVAYAGGFATGNAVGMWIEERLAFGMQAIRLISCTRSAAVAAGLRLAGYAVTEMKGRGLNGEVSICFVVAPRRETAQVIRVAESIDPEVFCTFDDVKSSDVRVYRDPAPRAGWWRLLDRK
ncbi:MAG: DUF2179 domain-containing protein [Phycisphaerae bacterium]|nr:DUF2179 domain-containing protein [Phycisphaerae bacterium]